MELIILYRIKIHNNVLKLQGYIIYVYRFLNVN